MRGKDTWVLVAVGVVFAVYFANVLVGAMGGKGFLSDIVEMFTLLLACILFVVAILRKERSASSNSEN